MRDILNYIFCFDAIARRIDKSEHKKLCLEILDELEPYLDLWGQNSPNLSQTFSFFTSEHHDIYPVESDINGIMSELKGRIENEDFLLFGIEQDFIHCKKAFKNHDKKRMADYKCLFKGKTDKERIKDLFLSEEPEIQKSLMPDEFARDAITVIVRMKPLKNADIKQMYFDTRIVKASIDSVNTEMDMLYSYNIRIKLPKVLYERIPFGLVDSWRDKICRLGNLYPCSVGAITCDVFQSINKSVFFNINNAGQFSKYIPGYAWGCLYTCEQIEHAGGYDKLVATGLYNRILKLEQGNVWVEMTEKPERISPEIIRNIATYLRPYMKFVKVPVGCYQLFSFRCALRDEDIIFNEDDSVSVMLPGQE